MYVLTEKLKTMLLNLSNHPFAHWSEKQKETARRLYGLVTDLPFPLIDPHASTEEVKNLAAEYFQKVMAALEQHGGGDKANAVHIQGEFLFVCHIVALLKQQGVTCVASTSVRDVRQEGGKKIINFNFIQFRQY